VTVDAYRACFAGPTGHLPECQTRDAPMHSFRNVSDIRIEPGGTRRLDALSAGLPRNKRGSQSSCKGRALAGSCYDACSPRLQDAANQ